MIDVNVEVNGTLYNATIYHGDVNYYCNNVFVGRGNWNGSSSNGFFTMELDQDALRQLDQAIALELESEI